MDEKTEIVAVMNIDNLVVKTVDEISSDIVLHGNGDVVAVESTSIVPSAVDLIDPAPITAISQEGMWFYIYE